MTSTNADIMDEDDLLSVEDADLSDLSLNITTTGTDDNDDRESISLLRQIFPDEPIEELRRLHQERLGSIRQSHLQKKFEMTRSRFPIFQLPHDFLRLPPTAAVLRCVGKGDDSGNSIYRYESLQKLEKNFVEELKANGYHDNLLGKACILTRAVVRHAHIGLGMTLSYDKGQVSVYSVFDREGRVVQKLDDESDVSRGGPSMKAGIRPGDVILGFNGHSLVNLWRKPAKNLLSHIVQILRESPDPVVIHCRRAQPFSNQEATLFVGGSLLDETLDSSADDMEPPMSQPPPIERVFSKRERQHRPASVWSTPFLGQNGEPRIHALIQLLSVRGLVPSKEEEMDLTAALGQFNERAWEIETFASLRLSSQRRGGGASVDDTLIPLVGVRKALSIRILNYFTEGPRVAYTIWVYDVESSQEWYAPLRYLEDFVDLRHAATNLIPPLGKLPFPRQQVSSIFGGSPRWGALAPAALQAQCWQLEKFLRSLCSLLYENQLTPTIGEVAVHVQSFLGCETVDLESNGTYNHGQNHHHCQEDPVPSIGSNDKIKDQVAIAKNRLKRSIQCYTHRVFLLRPLTFLVDDFVETMRQKCPSLQDLENMESQGVDTLQKMGLQDLASLERFLDFLQSTILDGCIKDFQSISMHETFSTLQQRGVFLGKKGEIAWNALVREAVREQVEVEAYVPLRSVVSRWLVNGWRHEDMEAHFKINELRKRPVEFFNVPPLRGFTSVARILKDSVERSTLPCAKLHAIVEAARKIARICTAAEPTSGPTKKHPLQDEDETRQMGADQFLPILIYCVVMANIERPCALCVLLRALCDKVTKIGEVGYYLASFEAAVVHVRDFDLSDSQEQTDRMRSFVSVNID